MNKIFAVVNITASILTVFTFLFGEYNFKSAINMDFIKEHSFLTSLGITSLLWIAYLIMMLIKQMKSLKKENAVLHRRIDDFSHLVDERFKQISG